MRIAFTKCHGSGNDFALIDARGTVRPRADWAAVARALANRAGPVGSDGLLLLVEGDASHAFGMRMFNADGSEAETCLNGLRCVARAGFEALGIDRARVKLRASSAEVARAAPLAHRVATVRTRVGSARTGAAVIGFNGSLAELPSPRDFVAVAMPNPHLVSFVEQVDEAELAALGEWCEGAPPMLPGRANVSFVETRGNALFVRTFERGVGLTNACGSAMAASVFAAGLTGRVAFGREVAVFNKGGLVRGRAEADGEVTIVGNATFEWEGEAEIEPARGVRGLTITRRRAEEVAAWDAALAALR